MLPVGIQLLQSVCSLSFCTLVRCLVCLLLCMETIPFMLRVDLKHFHCWGDFAQGLGTRSGHQGVGSREWAPAVGIREWAPGLGIWEWAPGNGHQEWAPGSGLQGMGTGTGHQGMGSREWTPGMGIREWAPGSGHQECVCDCTHMLGGNELCLLLDL